MTFWRGQSTDSRKEFASSGDDELRMIPRWAIAVATAIFVAMQYVFFRVMPAPHHPAPLPMRMMMSYAWGAMWASYVLLIGYVSRDARRRGMSVGLWILVCFILPGGIGAVVYFLLRQPVLMSCPNCSTSIAATFHFCPQCQFQIAPVCRECHRGVKITDVFCVQCGHDLAEDGAPARLRVYSD
jgi:hypothetical protein